MKNINRKTLTLLVMVAALSLSCKKSFLEITPKGKLITETIADYDLSLNNLTFLTGTASSLGGDAQVVMGDEMAAIEPYFSGAPVRTQRLFRWDKEIYELNQDAQE